MIKTESKDKKEKKQKRDKKEEEIKVDKAILNENYPEITYCKLDELTDVIDRDLNIVVIGHVDSGKSTLTGHLLYKLGHISESELRKHEKKTEEYGKAGFEFAYIMDETEEE